RNRPRIVHPHPCPGVPTPPHASAPDGDLTRRPRGDGRHFPAALAGPRRSYLDATTTAPGAVANHCPKWSDSVPRFVLLITDLTAVHNEIACHAGGIRFVIREPHQLTRHDWDSAALVLVDAQTAPILRARPQPL